MPSNEVVTTEPPLLARHHFLLRRLHSLTGIVPIGVFLIAHLTANSSIVWAKFLVDGGDYHAGVKTFQHEVDFIHSLPALVLIEIFGLWLPIAFHSILGVYYAMTGKSNVKQYGYQANWRYSLQRISGYVGVLFIFYHVATLRWGWGLPFSYVFDAEMAASTTALALRGGMEDPWQLGGVLVGLFYLLGVSLLVFHFANGLWTAAITWGLTLTRKAMRNWGYVCFGIGAALMAMGWAAVLGFILIDLEEIRKFEQQDAVAPVVLAVPDASAAALDRK